MTAADTIASPIRTAIMTENLTPTFAATADSTNKLWENDIIIAIINTSLTVKSKLTIAPIPAYKFKTFASTNGTAASPDKPINPINGSIQLMISGKTGVYCKIVTINVIGKIILPNVHVVSNPLFNPFFKVVCNLDHSLLIFSSYLSDSYPYYSFLFYFFSERFHHIIPLPILFSYGNK